MTNYDKIKKTIKITVAALTASAALLVGVQQYQKVQNKKEFDKLPKAEQELVIKLREQKIPDKTIQINIDAYNKYTELGKIFNKFVEQEQKVDSITVKSIDEITERWNYKCQRLNLLRKLLKDTDTYGDLTLLDTKEAEDLEHSINEMISQIAYEIENLQIAHNKFLKK